ncbi:MAG: hypothetical protein R3F43_08315 [bacterium]
MTAPASHHAAAAWCSSPPSRWRARPPSRSPASARARLDPHRAIPAATWDAYVEAVRARARPAGAERCWPPSRRPTGPRPRAGDPPPPAPSPREAEAARRYVQLRTPEAYVQLGRLQGLALQALPRRAAGLVPGGGAGEGR